MISFTYAKFLQNICLGICLAIFSLPASAMCFYNKMNPSDYLPKGYNASHSEKTVRFGFKRNGAHLTYSKSVGINQHQCIGGGGATVEIAPISFYFWDSSAQHVGPHGYVVVETEPSSVSTASNKHFKLKMKVYSQSNALQHTYKMNLRCKVDPGGLLDSPALKCWGI